MKKIFTLLLAIASFVAAQAETKSIWEGANAIANWDNDVTALSWGGYDWSTVEAGTTLTVNLTESETSDYWQVCLALGDGWVAINDQTSVNLEAGQTSFSYDLTADDISALTSKGGLIVRGAYITVTSITLTTADEEPQAESKTIWEGSNVIANWDNDVTALSWGGYDWSSVEVGASITVNLSESETSDYWQVCLALGDGWAAINDQTSVNLEAGQTSFSYVLTAADIEALSTKGGLIVRGAYITVTSIVLNNAQATATGVKGISTTVQPQAIYNLNGQRVAPGTKGILIVGGKKILVK